MELIQRTFEFGPHRVDVAEIPEDEGGALFVILVDGVAITAAPLTVEPSEDEVVHAYSRWLEDREEV